MRFIEDVAWVLMISLLAVTAIAKTVSKRDPQPNPPAVQPLNKPSGGKQLRNRKRVYYAALRPTLPSAEAAIS